MEEGKHREEEAIIRVKKEMNAERKVELEASTDGTHARFI